MLWGRLTGLGLAVGVTTAAIDQASKLWLLYVFDIRARIPVQLTPFLDLAVALGLITGGAVGNAIDPFVHEGVADFVLFHITTETIHFNWYVFNFADTAIVAGVAGLLYESLFGDGAAKAPRSGS
jgi:signal peptidase II